MNIRSRRFQFWIARLALVAILLAALAPTMSRWLESGNQRLPDALAAMCTSGGLSWLQARSLQPAGQEAPVPAGGMQDEYCGYCPLLTGVVPVLLAIILLLPMLASVRLPQRHATPLPSLLVRRGLGARGPPILL